MRGAYLDKRRGTWYVQITIDGKKKTVASGFATEEEAARVYDQIARRVYGPNARTNDYVERSLPTVSGVIRRR